MKEKKGLTSSGLEDIITCVISMSNKTPAGWQMGGNRWLRSELKDNESLDSALRRFKQCARQV